MVGSNFDLHTHNTSGSCSFRRACLLSETELFASIRSILSFGRLILDREWFTGGSTVVFVSSVSSSSDNAEKLFDMS